MWYGRRLSSIQHNWFTRHAQGPTFFLPRCCIEPRHKTRAHVGQSRLESRHISNLALTARSRHRNPPQEPECWLETRVRHLQSAQIRCRNKHNRWGVWIRNSTFDYNLPWAQIRSSRTIPTASVSRPMPSERDRRRPRVPNTAFETKVNKWFDKTIRICIDDSEEWVCVDSGAERPRPESVVPRSWASPPLIRHYK